MQHADRRGGLYVVPCLLDIVCQRELLWRLLHRDLADERHATNVGLHYRVPYEICAAGNEPAAQSSKPDQEADEPGDLAAPKCASFFSCPPSSDALLEPLDASVHKALTMEQFLNKKLRWITLGGQYVSGHHRTLAPTYLSGLSSWKSEMLTREQGLDAESLSPRLSP